MSNQIQSFLMNAGVTDAADVITLVKSVAEIPWGEARSVDDVLLKRCGTCTGKHMLLQACFNQLGIEYRPVVCTFRWSDQDLLLPESLQLILSTCSWNHGHNFMQIHLADGKWLDIDVTWDSPLKKYGFRTFPTDWDGKSSFVGAQNIVERWDGISVSEKKKELISSLSSEQKDARDSFLEGFILWISSLRK